MILIPVVLSVTIAFAATLSAGVFIKKFQTSIGVVCAFSAGFFIALSLLELTPDFFSIASDAQIPFEIPVFMAFGGFLFLLCLDRFFSKLHFTNQHEAVRHRRRQLGLLSTLEFCSHGVIEGLAIGVGFQLQFGLGVVVAIAVVSHDFCDGISALALMLNSGISLKSSLRMLFIDAVAPVLGASTTFFFSIQKYLLVVVLSFLAGSFLYMGGGTLLPDANRMNRPVVTIVFFLFGFLLILIFAAIKL